MQVMYSPERDVRCSRMVCILVYRGRGPLWLTCTRTTWRLPSSAAVAKQCTPSSIQTALIFAWCCVYVNRGLLVTLRSKRAVSQTFTVLSSEDETKNTWSGDTARAVTASL